MYGLLGIQDPRAQGRYPAGDRMRIPERGGSTPMAQPAPQGAPMAPPQAPPQGLMGPTNAMPMPQGMGGQNYQSPSQGLFQAYMQNIFNQRYAPPVMPGAAGGIQQFNGFRGFGSPQMAQVQRPQQQQQPVPSMGPMGTPFNPYSRDPNNFGAGTPVYTGSGQ